MSAKVSIARADAEEPTAEGMLRLPLVRLWGVRTPAKAPSQAFGSWPRKAGAARAPGDVGGAEAQTCGLSAPALLQSLEIETLLFGVTGING